MAPTGKNFFLIISEIAIKWCNQINVACHFEKFVHSVCSWGGVLEGYFTICRKYTTHFLHLILYIFKQICNSI